MNPESIERLWKMFFAHLPRNTGMALVEELLKMHKP